MVEQASAAHDHWGDVEEYFDAALDVPPGEREERVLRHITSPGVRAEVEAMLAAVDRVNGVLDRPPLHAPADDDMAEQVGAALAGRYTVQAVLGRGGSATVLRALEHKHERTVVLKVLHPDVAAQVGVERFLSEVRIAAQLAHPHILPLIDSGEADGLVYYVMPHVDGETLRARLDREGALPVRQARTLLRDVASALQAAHAAGIVHRDLKPDNILCAGDHAYLLDFGIALGATREPRHATLEGVVVGTMGYMSPEQAAGGTIGPASDVYAWGVLACEMLTGRSPLDGDRSLDRRDVPRALARTVRDALQRAPAERPASGAELVARLGPPGERMARGWWGPGTRGLWAAAAALALLVGAAWFRRGAAPTGGLALPIGVAPLHNETGDTTLAIWGRMAGDWLTQGLHEAGAGTVIPWPSMRHASETATERTPTALAREVGARTVVSGSYYLADGQVGFRLDVIDAGSGELVASLPPVVAPRDSLELAMRMARERLMGFVAVQHDERAAALPGLITHPPTFAGYQSFDRGLGLYNQQQYASAATEFREAWDADTTFPVPLIYAAMAFWNTSELQRVDTLLTIATRFRQQLSAHDQRQLDYLSALMASDGERAIAFGRRAAEIAPEARAAYHLGRDLIAMDRPAEGRAVLEAIDPDRGLMKGWASYWTQLAHARHLTGGHREELQAALTMRARFPENRVPWVLAARALGALGDTRGLDSLLVETAALPPGTYWSHGGALVTAGEELFAHRDSVAGRRYLELGVTWLREALRADSSRREHRYWLGSAYYDLGRWADADTVFAGLAREFPERMVHRGMAALSRARRGDLAGAERVLGPAPRFARGEYTMYRARLAAIAGDTAAARALRLEALSQVSNGWAWVHASGFRDVGLPAWTAATR